jgi:MOSC domain-containing protein YiiM
LSDFTGKVTAVHLGPVGEFKADECEILQVELDGLVGDRHRGYTRENWEGGDKQAEGVVRRNERQWSAMSLEDLKQFESEMAVDQPLTASCLGVNILIEGIPNLSLLPKGTVIKFKSGAELMVEEYNPPCAEMAEKLTQIFTANVGKPLALGAFPKAAKHKRGLVGTIEVAGTISAGDTLEVHIYSPPKWMLK